MASKDTHTNRSKFKATIAFLLYAVRQEEELGKLPKAPLHATRLSQLPPTKFMPAFQIVRFWEQGFPFRSGPRLSPRSLISSRS